MKLYQKILLTSIPFVAINLVGTMTIPEDVSIRIGRMLLGDLSALLGVVSVFLFRREIVKETRLFFLILAAMFFLQGLVFGLFLVTKKWLIPLNEWSDFYEYQYRLQIYFLLLSGCVVYLVVDLSLHGLSGSQKYLIAFVAASSIWGASFYPYYANPRYLYTTSDIEDYRAIRAVVEDLQKQGVTNPSSEEIASHLGEHIPESATLGIQRSARDRQSRVREILPYLRGDDVSLLVLRPL